MSAIFQSNDTMMRHHKRSQHGSEIWRSLDIWSSWIIISPPRQASIITSSSVRKNAWWWCRSHGSVFSVMVSYVILWAWSAVNDAWSTSTWHTGTRGMIVWSTSWFEVWQRLSSRSAANWNLGWCPTTNRTQMDDTEHKVIFTCAWIPIVLHTVNQWWSWPAWFRVSTVCDNVMGHANTSILVDLWCMTRWMAESSHVMQVEMSWSQVLTSWQICIHIYGSNEINWHRWTAMRHGENCDWWTATALS